MLTDFNDIWWKYTWLYLQQIYMQHVRLMFIKHRYFKFKSEVKYFSISTMQQLKHRESRRLCGGN